MVLTSEKLLSSTAQNFFKTQPSGLLHGCARDLLSWDPRCIAPRRDVGHFSQTRPCFGSEIRPRLTVKAILNTTNVDQLV